MILGDFHTHTTYCDGKNTPREMAIEAKRLGCSAIGFTGHGYTYFDTSYCMTKEGTLNYIKDINELKSELDIDVLCGIEADIFSNYPLDAFDYVIASAHYVKSGSEYLTVDFSADMIKNDVDRCFGGDIYAYCESYFEALSKARGDILGHIDLVTKFNEKTPMIDITNQRYVNAVLDTVDCAVRNGLVFEVNTGAISRGYRSTPYPAPFILKRIKEKNGNIILTGDTHSKETLCYQFDKAIEYVKANGFNSVLTLTSSGFKEVKI